MTNFKISFDYDGTLTRPRIIPYAKLCKRMGCDIHILTSRQNDISSPDYVCWLFDHHWFRYKNIEYSNNEIFFLAKEIGIPNENIHFNPGGFASSGEWKNTFFTKEASKNIDYLWHLDDDCEVVNAINNISSAIPHKVKAISCYKTAPWLDKCNTLIAQGDWATYLALRSNS